MSLELAILGFLGERPQSGYDLKTRSFEGPLRTFWSADQAQIYRTLERLRGDGLVTFRRRRQSSRPDRRVFELTGRGREALDQKAGDPGMHAPLRDAYLVQLYFSAGLSDEALLGLMRARREECQQQLDAARERAAELAADASITARAAVLKQTALDGVAAQLRTTIDWLDDCIQAVEEGALPGSESGTGQRHLFGG